MKLHVGDIVKIKASFLGEPANCLGYVYEKYRIGNEGGVQILTENMTDLGGFSDEECNEYLEYVRHSNLFYSFSNVMQLDNDIRKGFFKRAFDPDFKVDTKEIMTFVDNSETTEVRTCGKGAERCNFAQSKDCDCQCGGDNHGKARKLALFDTL